MGRWFPTLYGCSLKPKSEPAMVREVERKARWRRVVRKIRMDGVSKWKCRYELPKFKNQNIWVLGLKSEGINASKVGSRLLISFRVFLRRIKKKRSFMCWLLSKNENIMKIRGLQVKCYDSLTSERKDVISKSRDGEKWYLSCGRKGSQKW